MSDKEKLRREMRAAIFEVVKEPVRKLEKLPPSDSTARRLEAARKLAAAYSADMSAPNLQKGSN
jgi:hypothetical protein